MLNTSTPIYSTDGQTAGCYVWRNDYRMEWIVVKVRTSQKFYPTMLPNQSIQKLAKDVFKFRFSND